ncbi:MAG: hypothetical protein K9I29_04135 [Bacteroidales bacterium]|nr:hypothetical protein [Bacteroidales bacterium]MCF8327461.1 hypothetical protein [Bacteroidales bacterium]
MIKSYSEMQAVKKDLKDRIRQTEQQYASQHEWIATFLNFSGIHDGTKNQAVRENLHVAIIQSINEYLKQQNIFKKINNEYIRVAIPFVITLASIVTIKRFQ